MILPKILSAKSRIGWNIKLIHQEERYRYFSEELILGDKVIFYIKDSEDNDKEVVRIECPITEEMQRYVFFPFVAFYQRDKETENFYFVSYYDIDSSFMDN